MLAPVVTETDGNNNNNQRKKVKMREKHLTTITAPSARPTTCEVVLAEEVVKKVASVVLLNPKQVQRILQTSQWGFDELVRKNLLTVVRVGHKRLVELAELQSYITKSKAGR
jgi:hypothetical protein